MAFPPKAVQMDVVAHLPVVLAQAALWLAGAEGGDIPLRTSLQKRRPV